MSVSTSLCRPRPAVAKAWGIMVECGEQSVSLWFADKGSQSSCMTKMSSACPLRKRKWLDPSLKDVFSPLQWVLWNVLTKGHFSLLFWVTSSDIISVLVYLEMLQYNCHLGVRRHLKYLNQASTFQEWLVSNWNALIRDQLYRERCLAPQILLLKCTPQRVYSSAWGMPEVKLSFWPWVVFRGCN